MMLLVVFLYLVGIALLIGWHAGGRKNMMVRNAGAIALVLALLLSLFGLYLYLNPY